MLACDHLTRKTLPVSKRCAWAVDPLMIEYHDREWGVPLHDDQRLFELLTLEGAQAGLSWSTILRRRENYRRAFDGFDPEKIAKYTERDFKRLMGDEGIIRNRLKILSVINNAKRFLEVKKEFGSFDEYVWSFVDHTPIVNKFRELRSLPSSTPVSDGMSTDMKKRGFGFIGSTICYAFMQGAGLVDDHTVDCFRYGMSRRKKSG
jgi:DNA-3-methyladenine glycosylase I